MKSDETKNVDQKKSWGKRLGWFIAIWALSISALALLTYLLRFILTIPY